MVNPCPMVPFPSCIDLLPSTPVPGAISSCFYFRAVLSSFIETERDFIWLPSSTDAKRCVAHFVHLDNSFLALEYLRSAWTGDKYNRHNAYFVVVPHLEAFENVTILMDFERLYLFTDNANVGATNVHAETQMPI